MLPISQGDIIIGRFVENSTSLVNNSKCVLALKNGSVVFKRVVKEEDDNLILVSDNKEYLPFNVHLSEVLEAWEMVAFIGYGNKVGTDFEQLTQRIDALEQSINQLIKINHLK